MVTLVNRAKVLTASTGTTSPISLGSAISGFQTLADAGVTNGQTVRYVIEDGANWEIGSGTYNSTGPTLSRTPSESSNAGSLISLSGSALVFITAAADDIQQPPAEGAFVDGDKTKLDGIEAGADVTDAGNVNPLVDSHLNYSSATTGQVLSYNGSDYDWVTATISGSPVGPLAVIASQSAPVSGSFEFTGLTLTNYSEIVIVMEDITVGANGYPKMTFYVGGTEVTTGYHFASATRAASSSTTTDEAENTTNIPLLGTNSAAWWIDYPNGNFAGKVSVFSPAGSLDKNVGFRCVNSEGDTARMSVTDGGATLRNTGAIDGIKISGSVSLTGGRVTIYGVGVSAGADVDAHLNTSTAASGEVLSWTGSDYDWIAASGGAFTADGSNNLYAIATLPNLTTGTNNFAAGSGAGDNITSGNLNIGIGQDAMAGSAVSNLTGSNNIGIGYQTGYDLTTGQYNFLGGRTAGTNLTTGSNNTIIGFQAGFSLTSGTQNIAIGESALLSSSTGGRNIAIGERAMYAGTATNATGDNIAIGYHAGHDITSGTDNFFGGYQAGTNITTGSNNVAIGNSALDASTASGQNVAIGHFAMSSGLASDANGHNVAVGSFAGLDISSGRYNFFGGYSAGANITTGLNNVAIGEGALDAATTAGQNIAIGKDAMGIGVATPSSGYNIAIGTSAGLDITSGTDNVLIGRSAGANINTGGRNIAIGGTSNVIGTSNSTTIVIGYDASPSSATASQEITLGGSEISRFRVPGAGIDNTSAALSGTTPSVDVGARDTYTLTTSGNTTFTFTGVPSSGQVGTFSLIITAGGTHTLTWPASVDWAGGTAPDAPASGEKDIYTFMTVDGGTTWYGFLAGDAMA